MKLQEWQDWEIEEREKMQQALDSGKKYTDNLKRWRKAVAAGKAVAVFGVVLLGIELYTHAFTFAPPLLIAGGIWISRSPEPKIDEPQELQNVGL